MELTSECEIKTTAMSELHKWNNGPIKITTRFSGSGVTGQHNNEWIQTSFSGADWIPGSEPKSGKREICFSKICKICEALLVFVHFIWFCFTQIDFVFSWKADHKFSGIMLTAFSNQWEKNLKSVWRAGRQNVQQYFRYSCALCFVLFNFVSLHCFVKQSLPSPSGFARGSY